MGEYKSGFTGKKIDELLGMVDQGAFALADHTHESNNVILWEGAKFMNEGSGILLSQKVSEQPHGIVLVFSYYDIEEDVAKNASWSRHFVPKTMIGEGGLDKEGSHTFLMSTFTSEIDIFGIKHLWISDARIDGYVKNGVTETSDCGIKYSNNNYVLRYVIGV